MDGLVFQSEGARDFFPSVVKQKLIVIHNSVNVPQDKYPVPERREKRTVNVGRLHPQKKTKVTYWCLCQNSEIIFRLYS